MFTERDRQRLLLELDHEVAAVHRLSYLEDDDEELRYRLIEVNALAYLRRFNISRAEIERILGPYHDPIASRNRILLQFRGNKIRRLFKDLRSHGKAFAQAMQIEQDR